ncbi:MAG: TetR/AcrR family transcriptional regulator, partial [Trebonia sp.]
MTRTNASMTARERARAELTREIKEEAKRQLAASGANGLSLRAVARSLGMVSSALYRYFPSRDDLLTALIIDAYNSMGTAVEEAISSSADAGDSARGRWAAACRTVRNWATARPHEYALIYGSPVPGYRAPAATIGPAARVPVAFIGILRGAAAGPGLETPAGGVPFGGPVAGQAAKIAADLA